MEATKNEKKDLFKRKGITVHMRTYSAKIAERMDTERKTAGQETLVEDAKECNAIIVKDMGICKRIVGRKENEIPQVREKGEDALKGQRRVLATNKTL